MDVFRIEGGARLAGTLRVNGSKNAALPQLAACLLTDTPVTLRDVPELSDIGSMYRLLATLGVDLDRDADTRTVTLRSADEGKSHATYDIMRTMRAGICTLGPMLARRGSARVSLPGGCAIGDRPVNLHLKGMRALGAQIDLDQGDIVATAPGGRLRGARVFLGGSFGSTVLGTANVMSAATLAEGTTIIESAACEPEIVDLADLLTAMGARIAGAGSPRITIEGVNELGGTDHRVIADRIEAGTFMVAAAITGGSLRLKNCPLDCMMAATELLRDSGVIIREEPGADPLRATCTVEAGDKLMPAELTTQPHPGFPTDLQAQFMALLCLADGNSVVTEKIFPERFMHVAELSRMGASLHRQGATVVVSGVRGLTGAPVMASDLRASAGLVLAGLAAKGQTVINRVYHLDRGYEHLETRLAEVGAKITRCDDTVAARVPKTTDLPEVTVVRRRPVAGPAS
ncbi:MAG: UDP-N-acetylglucosamine 1-carboxyvinyltransferase [Phycisphaeraceae bacterium]|nr:MAG: UDP-N-acetylglucosamine 1-carboxyvinyltransferase [Phycisphaeraceae bacterium]